MKIISSVKEIIDNYNYFIIDLWGVLHDGTKPYPNAVATLKFLEDSGKKIALLSNAPRRSSKAKIVLDNLGFHEQHYDYLLTSGEATFNYVKENYNSGDTYFYIGPEKDRDILNGSGLVEVSKANNAKFALVTGFDKFGSVFEERKYQADEALAAGLTLLCANPDRKVVNQNGETQICAGMVAEYYAQQGGKVIYFGKPYESVYQNIIKKFNIENTSEILCIGDSFHTDIRGANNIGADSLFVSIGIHHNEVLESAGNINIRAAEKLAAQENSKPTYIISEFK